MLACGVGPDGSDGSAPNPLDELLETGTSRYGRGKEELIARHFFSDRRGGFFADIGCFRPIRNNTTYYLEHHLGWSGIAVDAQKDLAPLWAKHRPGSRFVGLAISDVPNQRLTFYKLLGLSSFDREAVDLWRTRSGEPPPRKEIIVRTTTLDLLFEREGIDRIDFLKIDINGHEPAALRGFDIRRFRPELVHIEVMPKNRDVLARYFAENGYRRLDEYARFDPINWYFTPAR